MGLAAVIAATLLGGCSTLSKHFGPQSEAYKKSVEKPPLEVPPDLDTPATSNALIVPPLPSAPPSSSTRPAAAAPPAAPGSSAPPAMAATPSVGAEPPAMAAGPGVVLGGDGLKVADSVASTWTRVGLALERSGAATITARDEAGHSYTVVTTGQTTTKPGWFKRMVTLGQAGNKVPAKVELTVRVSAQAAGSQVSVEGAGDEASRDAAQSLLRTLRERLS